MNDPIPVVYEDDWLIILNKPAGLLTLPTPKKERRTLTSILNNNLKSNNSRIYPCHRLDRDTSGLIIYAKSKAVYTKVAELFKKRQVKKTYIGFVQGSLKNSQGRISYPLSGKDALTYYQVAEKKSGYDLVKITPHTGRTNQIRIHFKMIGHPLVGESKYAFRKDFPLKSKRLCLHAEQLMFIHSITKKQLKLKVELPSDLKNFLDKHKR
jgi:23S rRNA pseudouridine1911/1915/1917 synthase